MSEATEASGPPKPVHTIVLDAGPLIKNVPSLSTLLAQSHSLVTTPAVLAEIRDPDARNRIETLYLPFLTKRSPRLDSLKIVSDFARKTGDREVLSRQDLEILALAYEVECEKNDGDWRLRRVPGQKGINGKPPASLTEGDANDKSDESRAPNATNAEAKKEKPDVSVEEVKEKFEETSLEEKDSGAGQNISTEDEVPEGEKLAEVQEDDKEGSEDEEGASAADESDSDPGGWITPSNIKKRQARDSALATPAPEQKTMQVATITTDFAMQNVLLQMNLNLLSPTSLQRVKQLKSYILRCHGCFFTTREMSKQFCPRCGQATLNRVGCSTSSRGVFKIHLRKNMQWNNRGNVFSVPKPTAGTPHGKWSGQGGGKGGWGTDLILAEDQKEYVRSVAEDKRRAKKGRDLMDEDYLPAILSGERNRTGGRTKVGAGRNVNSRKRR